MKHVRSLLWALSLVLSFPAIALAQQSVSPCTRVSGGSTSGSCVPVTASAPLPVTGTVTSSSSAKATAAAPSYTEGTSDPLSQTLSGDLRTTNLSIGANSAAAKTSSTLMGVSDGTNQQQLIAPIGLADGVNGNNSVSVGEYRLNAAGTWDRVRSNVAYSSSSALVANQVVKASAGNLYSFQVSADSTLSAAAWWLMIYDATSAPADGAVTPAKCYAMPSGTTSASYAFPTPLRLGTGIVIGVSTTGCFTKTASTHAFISGDAQ